MSTPGKDAPIAFICAMPMELSPLVKKLDLHKTEIDGVEVHRGTLDGREVIAIVTGMGTKLASEGTERLLDATPVDRVVVVGVAGALDNETPIGTLILPEVVVNSATGAEYRPEPWWVTASVREIYRFKAERLNQAGLLTDELQNNYGNELRGNLSVGYIFDDMWTVGGAVDLRYVAANDYSSGDPLHDGGRIKVAVGPWVTWTFDRTLQIDASVRYFYLDANDSPLYPKGATFNGVTADVRLTFRF